MAVSKAPDHRLIDAVGPAVSAARRWAEERSLRVELERKVAELDERKAALADSSRPSTARRKEPAKAGPAAV